MTLPYSVGPHPVSSYNIYTFDIFATLVPFAVWSQYCSTFVQFPARGSTQVLLCLFPGVFWLWHFLYSVGPHPVSSPIYTLSTLTYIFNSYLKFSVSIFFPVVYMILFASFPNVRRKICWPMDLLYWKDMLRPGCFIVYNSLNKVIYWVLNRKGTRNMNRSDIIFIKTTG